MSIQQIRRSVLIAAGILALAVSGLVAGRLFGRQLGPDHGRGPKAQRIFEHLASELDLSAAQRTQIRGILKSHADEILAQVRASMDARRTLHEAVVTQPSDDAAIRSLAAQIGQAHADGALLMVKIRSEIVPVLTAEQKQKLASLHTRMGNRGDEELESLGAFLRGEN